jgi:hypothetical protein
MVRQKESMRVACKQAAATPGAATVPVRGGSSGMAVAVRTCVMAIVGAVCLLHATATPAASCGVEGNPLIKIELLQGGFAGQSGERTLIGADGCFTVDRVLNGRVTERVRSGSLGPEQMSSVRTAIEDADIAALPDTAGTPRPVNPALVTIAYGSIVRTVAAPAASGIEDVEALAKGPPETPVARAARLVASLLRLTR